MKKQLIAVGLAGLLTIPTVSFSAEMVGPSLYGSFRTGLSFGSGDASVSDFTSRWGFKGSHEVAEGLTASYKYESRFNTTNAESSGGDGHGHDAVDAMEAIAGMSEIFAHDFGPVLTFNIVDEDGEVIMNDAESPEPIVHTSAVYSVTDENRALDQDKEGVNVGNVAITEFFTLDEDGELVTNRFATQTVAGANEGDADDVTYFHIINSQRTGYGSEGTDAMDAVDELPDGGDGGRLSYVSLSGGFGTVTLGQIWSASAIHYGFKVDPSYVNGVFGGASYRPGNTVSYSSSAGDVSFQIDKVTGDAAKIEIGASANLGPVGIGFANWSNADDKAAFTGVAVSSEAAGLSLTVGLGSITSATGAKSKTNVLHLGGSVGDTGLSYAVQIANSDADGGVGDQNLLVVTNSLGSGASLIFEHVSHGDPAMEDKNGSLLGLKVDF